MTPEEMEIYRRSLRNYDLGLPDTRQAYEMPVDDEFIPEMEDAPEEILRSQIREEHIPLEVKEAIIQKAKAKMPVREEMPEKSEAPMPQAPEMEEGFLARIQEGLGSAGSKLSSILSSDTPTANKIKEKARVDHVQDYLDKKNSLSNKLLGAFTGAMAGGSGRGIGEITNAMRIKDSAGMREAQALNLHDPNSELSAMARQVAFSLDRVGTLNIDEETSAAELFQAMPWLEKILLDENRIEGMNFNKTKLAMDDAHRKSEFMRKLEDMALKDRWKQNESGDRKSRLELDRWRHGRDLDRKDDQLDFDKGYKNERLGLDKDKFSHDVFDKDRKFGLDQDKFGYDQEYKNRGLDLKEKGLSDLDSYRKNLLSLKERELALKRMKALQTSEKEGRGRPIGEVTERDIADLQSSIEMSDHILEKIMANPHLIGRATATLQKGLSKIPIFNLNDPEWIALESELSLYTKALLKAMEGGRPSDFDASSYAKIVGNQYNSQEELMMLIKNIRDKSKRSLKNRLDSAKRNRKDISGYQDVYDSLGAQGKQSVDSTIIVSLPDGRTGKIPANKVNQFLKDNPGSKVVK